MQNITAGESTEMNLYGPNTPTGERGGRVLHVVIHHHGDHVSLLFTNQGGLNRALPVDTARAYLSFIREQAKAGHDVYAIVDMAGAWTSAMAIVDDADRAMVDGIRANMEAATPVTVDVSDIVADMPVGGSWNAYRQGMRRDFTRTRVHTQEPTPAELGRIRAHRDGVVTRAPGQSWTLLRAIVRRGLAVEHEVNGGIILSVRLNQRGMAYTQTSEGVAA